MIKKEYLYGIIACVNILCALVLALLYALKTVPDYRYFTSLYFSPELGFGIVSNLWSRVIITSILVLFVAGWWYREPFLMHPWRGVQDIYYRTTGAVKSYSHKKRHDSFLKAVDASNKDKMIIKSKSSSDGNEEYNDDIQTIIKQYSAQNKAWTVPEVMKALEQRRFIPPHQKHQVVQHIRDFRRYKTFHI